jgi:DNA-binding MurR/RpiR family transcriptional regulator
MAVKDEIFERMELLSPAEKKVARTLLADYPSAGLGTAAALAKAAGTSTPTVLRLLARLQIGTYPAFQERLRAEVSQGRNSPASRATESFEQGRETAFDRGIGARADAVRRVLETVPPAEFDAAVSMILRCRRLVMHGGYFSRYIVQIFGMQLDQLIPGVVVAEEPLGRDASHYFSMDKDSVALIIDMRRYETVNREAAALARRRGARVVLITDEELSPVAEHADVVLPVQAEAVPFDTFVALLALVESLVDGVFRHRGEPALERMRAWEQTNRISRAVRED